MKEGKVKIKIVPMFESGAIVEVRITQEASKTIPERKDVLTMTHRDLVQLFAAIGKFLVRDDSCR